MELLKIILLARWAGQMIMRYAREAPLLSLPDDFKRLSAMKPTIALLDKFSAQPLVKEDRLQTLEAQIQDFQAVVDAGTRLSAKEETEARRHVRIVGSGIWHDILLDGVGVGPGDWQTRCGWRFASHDVERSGPLPAASSEEVCGRCFPVYKAYSRRSEKAAPSVVEEDSEGLSSSES